MTDFIYSLKRQGLFTHYPEIDSTNTKAKEIAPTCKDFTVLLADFQTAGRGQLNNTWHSEKSKNILCSIILKPQHINQNYFFLLTKAISLSVSSVISIYAKNVFIKWPNDIYINNKKIAGLLVENIFIGEEYAYSIVGFGININQTDFSSVLPNPTSLMLELGEEFNIKSILNQVLYNFYTNYNNLEANKEAIETNYLNALFRRDNAYHEYKDGQGNKFFAKILDVNNTGELILEKKSREISSHMFKSIEYIL